MANTLRLPSTWILLAANAAPLVGVVFWGWDAFVLLMLYWLETAVIAFWTIMRIATMSRADLDGMKLGDSRSPSNIGMALFFTAHAGMFMGVHFLFLWTLFSGDWSERIHGVRSFIDQMVIGTGLWAPLLVLFVGRGVLVMYETAKPALFRLFRIAPPREPSESKLKPGEALLLGLYLRIFVMQVTIILGAWVTMLIGTTGAYVLLIAIKTAIDISLQALMETFHGSMQRAKADAATQRQA